MAAHDKRPWRYAEEIKMLPREQWKDAVLRAPADYQEMIRTHLRAYLDMKKHGIVK
jgi:hypothetical protein